MLSRVLSGLRATGCSGLSTLCLSSALLLASTASQAEPTQAALSQTRQYHIEAQPVSSALIHFAQQAGLQISVDSGLVANRQAAAVQGNLRADQALNALLQGTGLQWRQGQSQALIIEPAPQAMQISPDLLQLGTTRIQIDRSGEAGQMRFDRDKIDRLPAGNGDITSLLKLHPNVQFDNSQQSSKTPGEIGPANVSINGAKFYQNAFVVDGMNMNNDLNPADSTHNSLDSVPGRSQGLALDTDLLDNITVHDSNVSAAYGGFNGGVIEANTRAPSKDFHGKISYQTTRSDWTRYHVDKEEQERFDGASSNDTYGYQPEFEKHIVRATLEGHLTENFGLLGSFTEKTSTIPVYMFSSNNKEKAGYSADKQDQARKAQNFFLKGVWRASDNHKLEASLTYAPEEASYYRDNALDTGYNIESGGMQFNFKSEYQASLAKVTQQVGLSRMENSRDSDRDDWMNWKQNEIKNWGISGAQEGGYGDIEQTQDSFEYKLDVQWDALELWKTQHRLRTGLEYQHRKFDYERLTATDVQVYKLLNNGAQCGTASRLNGNRYCSDDAKQFVNVLNHFDPGQFNFNINSWATYLEDEIQIGRVMLRPGVRVDSDNYMNKTTVAPRFALEWDIFGDRNTLFSAGINRYYGRSSASWALQEGRRALQSSYTRANHDSPWVAGKGYLTDSEFDELDIAYDDELTFGLSHVVRDVELGVKWVRRKGRDQVRGEKVLNADDPTRPSSYTRYTNNGKTDSETLTFTVTPLSPIAFWGTQHSVQLAADYSHRNSNFNTYVENFEDDSNDYVYYNGSLIHVSELPPTNFNHDWTYRLTTISDIPQLNLTLSNFLRYRSGLDTLKRTSTKLNGYNEMYDVSYAKSLTWDMRLAWELPLAKEQAAFVNLDIYNLTDRVVASGNVSESAAVNGTLYETGRQFWLEVGYRF